MSLNISGKSITSRSQSLHRPHVFFFFFRIILAVALPIAVAGSNCSIISSGCITGERAQSSLPVLNSIVDIVIALVAIGMVIVSRGSALAG